jgi:hypothetical protein
MSRDITSHKKAHEAQKRFLIFSAPHVPFCGYFQALRPIGMIMGTVFL